MKRALVLAAAAGALVFGAATSDAAPRIDFAGVALNVLPPGQTGELGVGRHSVDQIALYDGLTPLGGNVTPRDLTRFFKSARFGVEGKPERTVRPRAGLRIVRDRWGVPHVYGRTRADVEFGAGWVTAEDRGLLLQLLRPAGRIAALDVPGIDAFSFALSGRGFVPSAQAEQQLGSTIALLQATRDGRQLLADVRAFVAGINAYHAANRLPIEPWTLNDVAAMGALIGAVFGAGGGDETRRSMFLDALQRSLGDERGKVVFDDLRDRNDPETPTTIAKAFPWEDGARAGVGNATIDDGSFVPVTYGAVSSLVAPRHKLMSNALLVGRDSLRDRASVLRRRPAGRLLLPADPVRGRRARRRHRRARRGVPRLRPYVELGRGQDFSWSATSAGNDIIDIFVEELCGDDTHYRYEGAVPRDGDLRRRHASRGFGRARPSLIFNETVHGPVIGYATVGRRARRARVGAPTRNREVVSAFGFAELNDERSTTTRTSFYDAANDIEFTFNWFYADKDDIAMFSSGRDPDRHPDRSTSGCRQGHRQVRVARLPSDATSTRSGTPPSDGTIVNWNNKPAPGLAGGGRHTGPTARCTATTCSERPSQLARDAHARVDGRLGDEHGGDAGPAGRRRRSAGSGGARRPAGAERARPADVRAARRLARAGVEPARPRPQRHDRPSGRGDHGHGMAPRSRTR